MSLTHFNHLNSLDGKTQAHAVIESLNERLEIVY